MIKNLAVFILIITAAWFMFGPQPQAHWQGQLVSQDPIQTSQDLPAVWTKKEFTFLPQAHYHIKAVVLSKHHYWAGGPEDELAPYDLALGWGLMSDAKLINTFRITQNGRWYNYSWKGNPSIDPGKIIRHSSNNHIIAANSEVLRQIKSIDRFDVVELDGYLVNIANDKGWHWNTSLSREDTSGGACEVFWVQSVDRIPTLN